MAEERLRCRFGRAMRIKQARDFSRARLDGRRLVGGSFIVNWRALPADSTSRLGVITTKKLGNAVIRARARRLLREVFRLHQHDLVQPVDLVLVAQRKLVGQKRPAVETVYLEMLRKARLLKPE